jgi:hypothetical protein
MSSSPPTLASAAAGEVAPAGETAPQHTAPIEIEVIPSLPFRAHRQI